MTRYSPSRNYLTAGLVALGMAALSFWLATRWSVSVVPGILFSIFAVTLIFLATRPPVEIHPRHLRIGARDIPWSEIRGVDLTGWTSPLILMITLANSSRLVMIYPADIDSSMSLLRQIRRLAHAALLDGIPHAEFWGESQNPSASRKRLASPRYPLLRQEDEEEVERLYQRLKTVGHLDPKNGPEES
ncbi:MAG: hypothetical protein FJW20_19080 [Acidimicrobiia bacterium]|nr:hypothetical protein [Acidimicrobiia bacterium]